MNKLVSICAAVAALGLGAVTQASASPVVGFETQYKTVFTSCTLPAGSHDACEVAINAYSSAVVSGSNLGAAEASFQDLRKEVFAANAADAKFQLDIDALFELLLPNSGAIGGPVATRRAVVPDGGLSGGGGTGVVPTPPTPPTPVSPS